MATFHRIPTSYPTLDLTSLSNHIWFETDNLNSKDEVKREMAAERLVVLKQLQAVRLQAVAKMEKEVLLEMAC